MNLVHKLAADLSRLGRRTRRNGFQLRRIKAALLLEDLMVIWKPGKRGTPTLEAETMIKLAKKTKAHTDAEKATLKNIAELARAVALLTPLYKDLTKGNAAKQRAWNKYSKDLERGSMELLDALESGQGKKIAQAGAQKLSRSCTDCHSQFRD